MSLPNLSFTELAPYLINIELMVIFTLVALVIWQYVKRMNDANEQLSTIQSECQRDKASLAHETELLKQTNAQLAKENADWRRAYDIEFENNAILRQDCIELRQEMGTLISNIEREYADWYRHRWFMVLRKTSLSTGVEITNKVAVPLAILLGYGLDSIDFQEPVSLGQLPGVKFYKVLIRSTNSIQQRKPRFLIQAVESKHPITDSILLEASVFAKVQRVGKYVLTNGIKFYLGIHEIPQDRLSVICDVDALADHWEQIKKELEPAAFS